MFITSPLRHMLAVLATGLCLGATGAMACTAPPGASEIKAGLVKWTNTERAKAGLAQLKPNANLDKAAQFHACNMVKRNFYAHDAPGGPSFKRRLNRNGYRIATAVENLGRSTEYSLAAPIRMWKNSPEHHVNTVNPNIREMGFGFAMDAQGRAYYVFIGGAPR